MTSPAASTSSRGSRILGIATAAGLALYLLFALVISPADSGSDASENAMGQLVRIMYVHVPVAITCFLAFAVTAFAGVMWLWKKSEGWDLLAAASAQIGVLFTAFTLITGSIWGKIAWGTWWEWDARLTSTALLFVIGCGYLALRRVIVDPVRRARYSAFVGILAFLDVPIVHYSVDWWRGLHQPATITRFDPTIDGLKLFALMLGMVVFLMVYAWLLVHVFRLEWVRAREDELGLDVAIAERRAEGTEQMAAPSDEPSAADPTSTGPAPAGAPR